MTASLPHPHWCDPSRCTASGDGPHESEATQVRVRAKGEPPRLLMLLWAPRSGRPTRMRMIVVGDMLVNKIDLDLDSAQLAAVTIMRLLEVARPPEHVGPVPPAPPEDPNDD